MEAMPLLTGFRTWWTVFWVASVTALGLVPLVVDARLSETEQVLHGRTDPAVALLAEVASLHVRQRSLLRQLAVNPDDILRDEVEELATREEYLLNRVGSLLEGWQPGLRAQIDSLQGLSGSWRRRYVQRGHGSASGRASGGGATALTAGPSADEEALHYAVLGTIDTLGQHLDSLLAENHERLIDSRRLHSRGASAMLLLALFALSVSAVVGRRLRSLVHTSEERQAEAVAARAEVSAILDATGDAVLVVDATGTVKRANSGTSRLLGLDTAAIVGRPLHDLLHGRAPTWLAHSWRTCPVLQAVGANAAAEIDDALVWRDDGGRRSVRITVRPLSAEGGSDVVLTLSDVTGLRQTEAALRRAVDARDEAMAIVGHDLRNPLSSIVAGSELLVDVPLSDERRQQELESIRQAASRMNRMIRDLLDVATIDAGAFAVRRAPIDVPELIAEAAAVVQHPLRERDIELAVRAEAGRLRVEGDLDRLLQAVENLLMNAIRHSPRGGCILLTAGRVQDVDREGTSRTMVEIAVEDSGPGVPAEELPHLFERFWSRERAGGRARRRRSAHGTGLGLAIVRGIAEAHGGRAGVESEPGRGARFWIRVPVVASGPTSAGASPGSS